MKKIIKPYIEDGLILRLIEEDDLPHTLSWRNDPDHRVWFNNTNIISSQTHLKWFKEYEANNHDYTFIVMDVKNKKCGQLSIYNIDWNKKVAEFGRFLVNPKQEGHGIMTKACKLGIKVARTKLNIYKLILEVKTNNSKAIHIYKKCGFTTLGLKENGVLAMEKLL